MASWGNATPLEIVGSWYDHLRAIAQVLIPDMYQPHMTNNHQSLDAHYISNLLTSILADANAFLNTLGVTDPAWCLTSEYDRTDTVTGPLHVSALAIAWLIHYQANKLDDDP